jgi:hypothetical protein
VWWGAPEKDGAALYKSETWDRAKSPVTDRSGSGNPDHRVNRPDVLRDGEELS